MSLKTNIAVPSATNNLFMATKSTSQTLGSANTDIQITGWSAVKDANSFLSGDVVTIPTGFGGTYLIFVSVLYGSQSPLTPSFAGGPYQVRIIGPSSTLLATGNESLVVATSGGSNMQAQSLQPTAFILKDLSVGDQIKIVGRIPNSGDSILAAPEDNIWVMVKLTD